jgi:ferrous-iron efflux pump FieF
MSDAAMTSATVERDAAERSPRLMRAVTTAAVGCATLLLAAKTFAYFQTHSVAVLSSLADSALDILASGVNFLAVRHSLTPADTAHRFGHGKAEPLSALAQSAFITGSAVLLVVEGASRLGHNGAIASANVGIAIMLFSTVVTIALVAFQKLVVQRTASIAIAADFLHYTGDLLVNLSVIIALLLATRWKISWADPAFGIGIALFLLINAVRIAIRAGDSLMDRELPEDERRKIIETARRHPRVRNVHELRTRSSGMQKFIQAHIVLDNKLTLLEAHRISDEVEAALQADFPTADIILHQDPEGIVEFHPPIGSPL